MVKLSYVIKIHKHKLLLLNKDKNLENIHFLHNNKEKQIVLVLVLLKYIKLKEVIFYNH